jgi:type II secretory pathway pseudopilin PulG
VPELPNYKIAQLQIPMIHRSPVSVFHRRSERGYILITLILFVALVAVAALVMAPLFTFQAKRDREEELIHRGVQYSRAMKHFVKKFGRYPTRIEELENTNNIRFLRRRYKDPITGKDFKILHMGDVQMSFGGGLAGAVPAAGVPGAPGAPGIAGGPGQPGIANGALNTLNTVAAAGGLAAGGINSGGIGGAGGAGSPFSSVSSGSAAGATPDSNSDEASGSAQGSAPSQGNSFAAAGPGAPGAFGAVGQAAGGPNGQTFGGGPMVGVASTSKDKTIRVFNKKEHYNEWQFIYDPSTDRGGLLTTPNQPSLQTAAGIQGAVPAAGGATPAPGAFPGPPGSGLQSVPPPQSGPQTPQMPPDQ